MKKFFVVLQLMVIITLTGCVQHMPKQEKPLLTQLQVREIQSREFDTRDTKLVMKSMMNVLQDEGYIIKNAVLDLGLLNAEKNINIENRRPIVRSFKRFKRLYHHQAHVYYSNNSFFDGDDNEYENSTHSWEKQQILEASANISEDGEKTRICMKFQTKKLDDHGRPLNIETVLDPYYYQQFFEKVSKGIFIQQKNI